MSINVKIHNNILNLHGYKGNCENTMYQILKALFPKDNVISPNLNEDYDYRHPTYTVPTSSYMDYDLIVGTSLGGFYALNLWTRYCMKNETVPCIVFNPALRPWEVLPKLGYNHPLYLDGYKKLYNEHFSKVKNFDNLLILSGKDDDVVGDLSDEPLLQNCIKRIDCGHSASGNAKAIAEIKREIISFTSEFCF
jgi:predicted esterase YcpF (UPF0227 family)